TEGGGEMRRRDFLVLGTAAAAVGGRPLGALAQQLAKVPRVALVSGALPATSLTVTGDPSWAAFIQELARLGFVEGRTVMFERHLGLANNGEQTARTVVASAPDLIFLGAAVTTATALMALTSTIPMVSLSGDPLGAGLVS